ncbi:hypothetical protein F5X68DRAFT_278076 [Plectosphaerella plurivora]|uniref:Uncharacterized protein n=1 Tax=Plectosphaerella plurivora TaxID=936078 RepID=A0A9P8V635_9PEZI|nr:hypothetical protein F5X68DRAFT_278076 [Plectosphaerella plurivora]
MALWGVSKTIVNMLVDISTTTSSYAIWEFVAIPLPSPAVLWNATKLDGWSAGFTDWRKKRTLYGLSESGGLKMLKKDGMGLCLSGPAEWEDWSAETGEVGALVMMAGELLIPRKRIPTDLIVGLESPADEKHAYSSIGARFIDRTDTQSDPATKPPRERSVFTWWSFEILSLIASAACLAGMVALLAVYDDQPQRSWKSSAVTLNGVVAFLATMCRTFLMVAISAALAQGKWNQLTSRNDGSVHRLRDWLVFDDAAKGPWGSAQLIWRFKGFHIACVGALLTIISLAFGLFAQQLLDVEIREVAVMGSQDAGRVLRTTFASTKRVQTTSSGATFDLRSIARLGIYNGYMAENIDDTLVTCATGNCTWPIVPTVGVCGACVNITDSIKVDFVREIGLCNVTTPGDLRLQGMCDTQGFGAVLTVGPGTGEVFARLDEAPRANDSQPVIAEFGILGLPDGLPANTTIDNSIAVECALWYCVQAREVWIADGELHDDVVETWIGTNEDKHQDQSPGFRRDAAVNFTNIPSSFNTDPEEVYGIDRGEMPANDRYFDSILFGNVTLDGTLGISQASTDFAGAAHIGLRDIDAWIQRFAKSMTNNIRAIGYVKQDVLNTTQVLPDPQPMPDIAQYGGTSKSNQAFFVVYWSWLAYPAAMVALGALYLGFEATRTSRLDDVRPWKDDVMMPLSMGLDERSWEVARAALVEPRGARERLGDHEMSINRGDKGFPTGFVAKEH